MNGRKRASKVSATQPNYFDMRKLGRILVVIGLLEALVALASLVGGIVQAITNAAPASPVRTFLEGLLFLSVVGLFYLIVQVIGKIIKR